MTLIERIRKSRAVKIVSAGRKFTVCRPTDLEMLELNRVGPISQGDILHKFVIGWEGFTEADLFPGGTGEPVPFEKGIFAEWIADHPEHWNDISTAVVDAYKAHKEKQEATAKNSVPGSAA